MKGGAKKEFNQWFFKREDERGGARLEVRIETRRREEGEGVD
jgi:hypothetical protein